MDNSILIPVAIAILGAILGSFLNALLFRYNTGRSVARGRSQCMHCSHTLSAADLVPIVSFVYLQGRCRYCHSKLSWQYPLVEAAGAVLLLWVYFIHPEPVPFALGGLIWMTLLFVTVYDLRHQIIPWEASILLGVLGLVSVYVSGATLWSLLAGPILAAPLLLISLVSSGRWMGWGDGTLELGLGWLLGLSAGLSAFMLAFWIGAAVGIVLSFSTKRYTMKSEVAFAPFLILGAGCAYFLNVDFFQTAALLFY